MESNVQETVQQLFDAQTIAEHVYRMLLSQMQYPEFGIGGVPVSDAAKVFGKEPCWVRQGIRDGWLPIGYVTTKENGTKGSFYISPKKLWEETGYVWKGGMKGV